MRFTWEVTSGRYRSPDGLVREATVRSALEQVIAAQSTSMREATQALVDGRIALSAWQMQMMQAIKLTHLTALSVAGGGWNSLNQSDFGWVGQRIRTQYGYLAKFADQLASGQQPLTAQAVARAGLYAQAARGTHRAAQGRAAQARDMDQERNQLGVADHCKGCLAQTRIGWAPIGTLVPVGQRDCLSNCRCTLIYRQTPIEGGPGGAPLSALPGTGPSGGGMAAPPPGVPVSPEAQRLGAAGITALTPSARGALMATVSNKPWSSFSASDYSNAQWHRACLINLNGTGDNDPKSESKLPVKEPDGSVNRNALAAAAAVLAGGRGGVDAPPAKKKAAARALIGLYRQTGSEPPDSLKRLAAG